MAHLFRHALSAFDDEPGNPDPITKSSPEGVFSGEWLPAAQEVGARAEARLGKLEQKATGLLSVLAVVAPLVVSATIFVAKDSSMPTPVAWISGLFGVGAMLAVLLAFIAAIRALAVRGQQEIFIGGFVEERKVREYDSDFRVRGILWVAANREAINDHIADFVRASQMFLGFAIALILLVGLSVLPFANGVESRQVTGTIGLDSGTVAAFATTVARQTQAVNGRLDQLQVRLDSVATKKDLRQVQGELRGLKNSPRRTRSR